MIQGFSLCRFVLACLVTSCLDQISRFVIVISFSVQLLIDNISRPAPNITHLLLKFDLDSPVERTVLQPKFNFRYLSFVDFEYPAVVNNAIYINNLAVA